MSYRSLNRHNFVSKETHGWKPPSEAQIEEINGDEEDAKRGDADRIDEASNKNQGGKKVGMMPAPSISHRTFKAMNAERQASFNNLVLKLRKRSPNKTTPKFNATLVEETASVRANVSEDEAEESERGGGAHKTELDDEVGQFLSHHSHGHHQPTMFDDDEDEYYDYNPDNNDSDDDRYRASHQRHQQQFHNYAKQRLDFADTRTSPEGTVGTESHGSSHRVVSDDSAFAGRKLVRRQQREDSDDEGEEEDVKPYSSFMLDAASKITSGLKTITSFASITSLKDKEALKNHVKESSLGESDLKFFARGPGASGYLDSGTAGSFASNTMEGGGGERTRPTTATAAARKSPTQGKQIHQFFVI